MDDGVILRDYVLEQAGSSLVAAAAHMLYRNVTRPTVALETVSGIGQEIDEVILGLQVGRLALADAARTASGAISKVMHASGELDALIATDLHAGFAVPGTRS